MFSLSLYAGMITDSDRSAALPPGDAKGTGDTFYAALAWLSPVSSLGSRLTIGGVLGVCAWPFLHAAAPWLPEPLRFLLGWFVFTIGPGFVVAGGVSRAMRTVPRAIVVLAAGTAATPVVIDLLGRAQLLAAFPYVACACAGAALVAWRSSVVAVDEAVAREARRDAIACALLLTLAAGLGAIVFWQRLAVTPNGISVYGDYDSADLSWYAVVASEASHTVPPTAIVLLRATNSTPRIFRTSSWR